MKRILTTFAMLAIFAAVAHAQRDTPRPASVFGLPLGQNFEVPECSIESIGSHKFYASSPTTICFEHRGYVEHPETFGSPANSEIVDLEFPIADSPNFAGSFSALIVSGALEAVFIATPGHDYQRKNLQLLKAKYGNPATLNVTRESNSFNAKFENIHATWNRGSFVVRFEGMVGSTDFGSISFSTPKADAYFRQLQKNVAATGRPL